MAGKYTILHGDSLQELKKLGDSSIDSVVSDPPYGLSKEPKIEEVLTKWLAGEEYDHGHGGFMGKSWDSFVPHPDIWREVYRVLKPGGHALIFAGTRTQDLMTISLRLAGFEVRDVIEWLYFSGFPKSHDVGKAFDKRKGGASFVHVFSKVIKEKRLQKGLSLSYMDSEVCGGSTNYSWFEGRPAGVRLPQLAEYFKIKEILELDDTYDDLMEAAEREKVGEKTSGIGQAFGDGVWVSESKVVDITAPATDLAKQWDGWGTALKPAHEPIIVVRKPLEGTVAGNVEEYGTSAINIDDSRIGERFPANIVTVEDDAFYSKYSDVTPNITPQELSKKASKSDRNSDWQGEEIKEVITWDDVKMTEELEELSQLLKVISDDITQGTERHEWSTLLFGRSITEKKSPLAIKSTTSTESSTITESKTSSLLTLLLTNEYIPDVIRTIQASGINLAENVESLSRSIPSITREETEFRHGVALAVLETLLRISEKGRIGNSHSTVKPLDLMAWLVRLVTPPKGTVLDPFAGSGSTLAAAKREGFGFVGVELTDEYIPIIEARTGEKAQESEGEPKEVRILARGGYA
ncbi:DNA methyltransferase [Oceanobacillus sojae]|uniref:DNA methyltransferase n=1 Tax=Oceanobacillus sojae TaxID=582851 RepID=UPI001C3783CC|nr:DNA methyltransferase [Oceanobacillus sojae]